ncbi:MAG TPA: hypothetical protein VKS82_13585 [Streptosporangiaceae bacterium]|nr:hypothetical protein [Streptosporangiaceae bacterium]
MRLGSVWRAGVLVATVGTLGLSIAAPVSAHPGAALPSYQGAPPPNWPVFRQCPVTATLAPPGLGKVKICIKGVASEGTINIGSLDTTFHGPGIIQGGTGAIGAPPSWADALDGRSFTAPQQLMAKPVLAALGNPPGVKPPAQSQVFVLAQQAGPIRASFTTGASGLVNTTTVPLSFQLLNPLLGSHCFVGTVRHPVVLNLTTGTSGTLTGNLGTVALAHKAILYTTDTEVVDGTFAAPGATGCGPGGLWDSALDTNNGLPSASGNNEAILYGSFDLAQASDVKKHLGE